jgi:hypothetical protein
VMIEVHGQVPGYPGVGWSPTRKRPQPGWQYVQAVKQREDGRAVGIEPRVAFGDPLETPALLGPSTSYIERTHLAMRLFNGHLVRKAPAFCRYVGMHCASAAWEYLIYNLAHPLESLRIEILGHPRRKCKPRPSAMASGLTDHIWTVRELLKTVSPPPLNNT